jgi:chemotaxis protein MotB
MAKDAPAPAGAPAWMVTFADLMSLLVCFFVLIISFSIQDEQKMQVVAGSVRDAFGVSKDWEAKALVEIDGRPKVKNVQLPPHQNIVVFMPRPDRRPPEDVTDDAKEDIQPMPPETQSPGEEAVDLVASAADFLENTDYSGDAMHAQIGDPGATGGEAGQGAAMLNDEWREQLRKEKIEKKEDKFVEEVRERLEKLTKLSPELANAADNIKIERANDGVRIQLIDDFNQPMFSLGSSNLARDVEPLVREVARLVAGTENRVLITGHTDSRPYRGRKNYDNWNLSSERAHATRQALISAGVPEARIAGVIGKGDSEHAIPGAPDDPRNRRIGILLVRDKG